MRILQRLYFIVLMVMKYNMKRENSGLWETVVEYRKFELIKLVMQYLWSFTYSFSKKLQISAK